MTYYLAFVYRDEAGFGFTVPDVEGFTAFAETSDFDAAASTARRVLAGHLASLIDSGRALPPARNLDDLRGDPDLAEDFAEATTTIMLPAIVPGGRTLRVNLSLDENTIGLIDSMASDRSLTRSAFVAEAARRMAMAD